MPTGRRAHNATHASRTQHAPPPAGDVRFIPRTALYKCAGIVYRTLQSTPMTQDRTKTDRPAPAAAKSPDLRERQAEALRRNLLRRKAQARRRDRGPPDGSAPDKAG